MLLSTILFVSGCASTEPGDVIVFSSDGNASISVPSGWNTNDTTILSGALIGASNTANQEFVVVTGEPKSNLGASSTVDDYLAQIKATSVSVVPDGVWGTPSGIAINDLNGLTVRLTGTWVKDKTNTTFSVNVLANNNYYYAVVGFTSTSLLAANEATVQTIINSFKAPATTHTGGWKPYTFPGSVILAFILLIVGIGMVFPGRRLSNRIPVPRPGKGLKVAMITVWALLILFFLSMVTFLHAGGSGVGPIFPITLACAAITFIYVAYISRHDGFLTAVGNSFVGAAAGPMVFEFPFDMIVIPQIKASTAFLAAYFVPLDFAVLLTLSFLLLSRRVFITRYAVFSLGEMFIVFAVWAWFGFSYPSTPVPFALNAISKVLGFVTIAALFSTGSKHAQDKIKKSTEGQN